MAGEPGSLSQTFGKVAKHIFSFTMIAMMVSVALPAVAAAAAPGAATLGDVGLSLIDHYSTMFTAPFTEFGTVTDIFNNTLAGNFEPGGYELGSGAMHAIHAGHAVEAGGAAASSYSGAAPSTSLLGTAGGAHAAHGGALALSSPAAAGISTHGASCAPFAQWSAANPAQLADLNTMAGGAGLSAEAYYQNTFCHH